MPPFYIGFSTVVKVEEKNYHGSVSSRHFKDIWQKELAENPELFKTKIVHTYATLKEAVHKEQSFLLKLNVLTSGLYINRSCFPHFDSTGRKRPDLSEWNKKRSGVITAGAWKKGHKTWNKGKTGIYSRETRAIIGMRTKDKTYEEMYGKEKSGKLRLRAREYLTNHPIKKEKIVRNPNKTQKITKQTLVDIMKTSVSIYDLMSKLNLGKTTSAVWLKYYGIKTPKRFYATGKKLGRPSKNG